MRASSGASSALPLGRAERTFLLLFLPVAFGFGGRMALVVFNGPLARLFTDNGYLIGLLLAVGPLVSALVNPAVGRFSDRTWTRFGRRLPLALVGVPLSTLVLFVIPSSTGYAVLLLLFALRALLTALAGVPLMSLIPDMTSPEKRGRAMALFMLVGGIGAIAVQVSGKFYWESRFEWVYYLTGILALAAIPTLFFIREPRPEDAELEGARRRKGLSLRALGGALLRGEPVAVFLASSALRYLGIGIVLSYMTLFAMTDLGISVGDTALAIAAAGAVRMLLAIPSGQLADRWNRRNLLLGTTATAAVLHLCTAYVVWNLPGLYVVLLVGAVLGTFDMVVSGPLFMDLMPANQRGELTGINMVLQNLFQAAGALLGGSIFAWTGGYRPSFAVAALCYDIAAVLLARVRVSSGAAAAFRP
jgi:maltose/moltooligosaccharide transporter